MDNNIAIKPFSIVAFIGVCKKYISKNLEFSVKLFIFASTRRKTNVKRQKDFAFGLSALISIENMLRKLYLSVIVVLCSLNAFALNLNALQGVESGGYAELAPPDTMRHEVFHSKFGNDVEFPKLGDNAKENAVVLSKFFSAICKKKDAKIETFVALIPLVPRSGDKVSLETLKKMMPINFRCFSAASMEYLLFCEMGGKNNNLKQIFYSFRNEASTTFTSLCHKYPDVYCAQLDSVIAFIKEAQFLFDGVGDSVAPIISVYLGEKTYQGVNEVWKLARKTAVIESILVTAAIIAGAPIIVMLLSNIFFKVIKGLF